MSDSPINLSALTEAQLREIAAAVLVDEQLRKDDPIKHYKPTVKQEQFHKSQKQGRWFVGGNRSGKTVASACEAIMLALGVHPWRKLPVPCDIWLVAVDNNQGFEAIQRAVREWLPNYRVVKYEKSKLTYTFDNGSTIRFKSAASESESFAGAKVHAIGFDEEPQAAVWRECMMRLTDFNGIYWVSMTPVNGISWAYDVVKAGVKEGIAELITSSIWDNPYVPHAQIEQLVRTGGYSEAEVQARLKGEWVSMAGARIFDWRAVTELRKGCVQPLKVGELVYRAYPMEEPEEPVDDLDPASATPMNHLARIAEQERYDAAMKRRAEWRDYDFESCPDGKLRIWRMPIEGHRYTIGADPSAGYQQAENPYEVKVARRKAGDPSAAVVLDTGSGEVVAEWHGRIPPEAFGDRLTDLGWFYNGALIAVENNTYGRATLKRLYDNGYGNLYQQENVDRFDTRDSSAFGFNTNVKTRGVLISSIQNALSERLLRCYIGEVCDELAAFGIGIDGKEEADPGCHDDRVFALGLALVASPITPYEREVKDQRPVWLKLIQDKEPDLAFQHQVTGYTPF